MLAFSQNASATSLTVGDTNTVGYVFFGIPSGDTDRTTYTNDLINFYNTGCTGDCGMAHGQDYQMVNPTPHFGATLPAATFGVDGTGTTVDNSGLYTYLFAKYDGPNQGSVVWYVQGLTSITIPSSWNGYGLSGWTLFGPHGAVPDGGTTVMLLGMALGALGMVRRYLAG